jgi:pimeloyl-ACP methyl ester carboxylesterase
MTLMTALATGTIAAAVPDRSPSLVTVPPLRKARGVALIAHGGKSRSAAPDSNLRTPALRMFPFVADLARAGRRGGLAVAQLRYRMVGYNDGDPVRDLEWALDELSGRFGAPVCLVGHSMGARAALRAAGHGSVTAVAGLAAWCERLPLGQALTRRFVLGALGLEAMDDRIAAAFALPPERALRVPL